MELFKMTRSEIDRMKDDTIQMLIKTNRELKSNYQATKNSI